MSNSSSTQSTVQKAEQIKKTGATHQQILMDWQGFILESTDTLFSTFPHRHRPVAEWSAFFESLLPALKLLRLDSAEVFLPHVNSVTNFLDGLYDCSFMRVEWGENQYIIVWNILDKTADLAQIHQAQQRFNEMQLRF